MCTYIYVYTYIYMYTFISRLAIRNRPIRLRGLTRRVNPTRIKGTISRMETGQFVVKTQVCPFQTVYTRRGHEHTRTGN